MDGDDRVEPGALPAAYDQLLVVELLEVAIDQLLVTVNTAAVPEPPEAREPPDEEVPEALVGLLEPDPLELDPVSAPVDDPAAPVEVVAVLPEVAVPEAARSVVVPDAAGVVAVPEVDPGVVAAEEEVVGAVLPEVDVLLPDEEVVGSAELEEMLSGSAVSLMSSGDCDLDDEGERDARCRATEEVLGDELRPS